MLVKFTDKWGDPVAVNPNEVAAVTVQKTRDCDGATLVSTNIHVDLCDNTMIIPVKNEFDKVVDIINAELK